MRTFKFAGMLGSVAALLTALAMPGTALAAPAQPSPVALDPAGNGNAPLVAYAPDDGYTYIAWSAPLTQDNGNGIDLCILPPNETSCLGGAAVLLTDPALPSSDAAELAGLVILPGSGDVVVLGASNGSTTGTDAWASAAGGAAFLTSPYGVQNAGDAISPVSLFYAVGSAVALSPTDVGLFDSYQHSNSYFSDSPFTGPRTPLTVPLLTGNANNGGQFGAENVSPAGSVIAAEAAPAPAPAGTTIVVGVGANVNSSQKTPSGCANYAASGYGVTVGTTGAGGTLNAQGLQPNGFSLLACSAESPVLASGGAAGIGVLEQEGSGVSGAGPTFTLDYRPFVAAATGGSFGNPVLVQDVTSHTLNGVGSLDASHDAGTGVYASWVDEQGLVLDYSPNSGTSWEAPVVLPGLSTGATQRDPMIVGVGGGLAEIAYDNTLGTGDQVFIQKVELAAPEPTTIATSQSSGTVTGADVSIPAGTTGETDQATLAGSNAAIATGSVTYGLYSNKGCTKLAASAGTAAVAAGKAGPSSAVTKALAPGRYYWLASYSGDVSNDPSKSACGSEALTITPPAISARTGSASGSTVTVTITCVGPCKVTATITAPGSAGAARAGLRKAKPRAITIATGRIQLGTAGHGKLKAKLTKAGKALLATDHGELSATIELKTTVSGGTFKTSGKLKIRSKLHT